VLLAAPPAAAEPYLTAEDAAELVEILAEATDRQDVCYGWAVDVSDGSGGPSGLDARSGRGVGNLASADGCRRWVELRGQVWWTAQTSDRDDDSVFEVVADGLRDPPTAADLAELGIPDNALVRDDGDVALYEAMLALPRIVADRGEAPPLELEPAASAPPAGSVPTGQPVLPDWLRQRWPVLGSGILLLLLAAALAAAAVFPPDRRPRDEPPSTRDDPRITRYAAQWAD
jgi:hypothetical protein